MKEPFYSFEYIHDYMIPKEEIEPDNPDAEDFYSTAHITAELELNEDTGLYSLSEYIEDPKMDDAEYIWYDGPIHDRFTADLASVGLSWDDID